MPRRRGPLVPVRKGQVGGDARILDGHDGLDGAIGSISGDLIGPALLSEAGMPEGIEHHLVLYDLTGCDQHREDDARVSAIDDVMDLVAEPGWSTHTRSHRGGNGIRGAHAEVSNPAVGMPLDVSLWLSFLGDPVMAIRVLLLELGRSSRMQWHRRLLTGLRLRIALRLITAGGKELPQMVIDGKARLQGVEGGVGLHFGGVEEELLPPHQPCLVTPVDDVLEEAAEDGQPQALSNSGEG